MRIFFTFESNIRFNTDVNVVNEHICRFHSKTVWAERLNISGKNSNVSTAAKTKHYLYFGRETGFADIVWEYLHIGIL